jgi:ABC-2 type transport system ATP-binding protein
MDEAGRCDRLLLLREGRLLSDSTPAELRARTGTDDLEEAFLSLGRTPEEVGVSRQGVGIAASSASEERSDRGGDPRDGARSGAPRGSEQGSPA